MPRRRHLRREQSRSPWTIILHLDGEKGREGSPRATLALQGLHFPPCVDVAWVDLLARVHFERENELRATRATKDEETRVKYGEIAVGPKLLRKYFKCYFGFGRFGFGFKFITLAIVEGFYWMTINN